MNKLTMATANDNIYDSDINNEITDQIKRLTRENGIAWLARTCKIILTELVEPKKVNICRSLCKIMDLLEKNDNGKKINGKRAQLVLSKSSFGRNRLDAWL